MLILHYTEKTIFPFPFTLNGIDRDDSFTVDFEINGISLGAKSKEKLSPRSYPIQYESNGNIVFSVYDPYITPLLVPVTQFPCNVVTFVILWIIGFTTLKF